MRRIAIAAAAVVTLATGALVLTRPVDGCGAAKCCRRPAGAAVDSCLRRNPRTGTPEDFGDLNTMPGSHAVGFGCEPAECVAGGGIEWLDGGIVPSEWL